MSSSAARIAVLIPALDEEASIGAVVREMAGLGLAGVTQIIVADNGSRDSTGAIARAVGALVVEEKQRGYGSACLAAMGAMDADINIVLFMDADGSDNPSEAAALIAPIVAGEAELVIGSRALGTCEPGAMMAAQIFGNWLASRLIGLFWGVRFTDLGPFRAISRSALERLCMQDRDFGWTVEMQIKAARLGLRCIERPVSYRKRVGVSKISGTVSGVVRAGWKILYVIAREAIFVRGA